MKKPLKTLERISNGRTVTNDCLCVIQLLLAAVPTTLTRLGDLADLDKRRRWLFHVPLRIAIADSIARIEHAR